MTTTEIRPETTATETPAPSHQVEVRRNTAVAAVLGVASSLLAIGYLARSVGGGGPVDIALTLVLGLIGNVAVLFYTVQDDPTSVIWCLGLVAVGFALFVFEYFFGKRDRPSGLDRGQQTLGEESR